MTTAVLALALFAAAYALSLLGGSSERRRFGFVSGSELIVLGVALGPVGLAFLDKQFVTTLAPGIILVCGWLALQQGLRLRRPQIITMPMRARVGMVVEPLFIGLFTYVACRVAKLAEHDVALLWSIIASGGTQSALVWAAGRYEVHSARHRWLMHVADGNGILGLLAMVYFATPIPVFASTGVWVTPAVVSVVALILGGLVVLLIGRRGEIDSDFTWVALLGVLALSVGLASRLGASVVAVTALIGVALGWTSPHAGRIKQMIATSERPFMQVLLLLIGMQLDWRPELLGTAVILVAVRLVAKVASHMLLWPLYDRQDRRGWLMGFGSFAASDSATLIVASAMVASGLLEVIVLAYALHAVVGDLLGAPLLVRLLEATARSANPIDKVPLARS